MNVRRESSGLIPIWIVFLGAVLLYAWLLTHRWISADEGAHLMDARCILVGQVPVADYGARMPLYCYVHALFQSVFGMTLPAGRIVPLLFTLSSGFLLFLIGRRSGGRGVGTVAALLFLFSPLTILYSTLVQTQPHVIFYSLLGVYLLLRLDRWAYFAAGICIACAFYVRESALAALLALLLVALYEGGTRGLVRNGVKLLAGFFSVALIFMIFYLRHMSLNELWGSCINPLSLPMTMLEKLLASSDNLVASPVFATGLEKIQSGSERPPSLSYLYISIRLSLLLIIGGLGALVWRTGPKGGEGDGLDRLKRIAGIWLFSITLFYSYWFVVRGFYPGYFREFEPPLALLAAIGLSRALRVGFSSTISIVYAVVAITLSVLIGRGLFPVWVEGFTLATAAGIGLFLLLLLPHADRRRWYITLGSAGILVLTLFFLRRPTSGILQHADLAVEASGIVMILMAAWATHWVTGRVRGAHLFLALALFGIVYSTGYAQQKGGISFQSDWPVPLVERVADVVAENSEWGEEVLSGGVIWTYLADRRPFLGINHPLVLSSRQPYKKRHIEIFDTFCQKPPRVVVMERVTESTFFRAPGLKEKIQADYDLVYRFERPLVEVWVSRAGGS